MLQKGDLVPHLEVETVHGQMLRYSTIWQQRNLVLVVLPRLESHSIATYVSELTARLAEFGEQSTKCVITRERVAGIPAPGVLVADRWGEIVYVAATAEVADLPSPDELLDWVEYVQNQCPECQGEAK
jgi:peroxiredoxin